VYKTFTPVYKTLYSGLLLRKQSNLRYFYGDFDIDKSKWFTHPELEELYRSVNRQDVPNFYDGVAQGAELLHIEALNT
jgi:hypothetical protein